MPQPLLLGSPALLGLAVGSFLNVVIHRVPRGESLLRPGSHCPHCGAAVRPPAQRPGARLAAAARPVRRLPGADQRPVPAGRGRHRGAVRRGHRPVRPRPGSCRPTSTWPPSRSRWPLIDLDVQRLPERDRAAVLRGRRGAAAAGRGRRRTTGRPPAAACSRRPLLCAFYFALACVYRGGMGFGDVKLAGAARPLPRLARLELGAGRRVRRLPARRRWSASRCWPPGRAAPQDRDPVRPVHARRRAARGVRRRADRRLVRRPCSSPPPDSTRRSTDGCRQPDRAGHRLDRPSARSRPAAARTSTSLTNFGQVPLPPGAVQGGVVQDAGRGHRGAQAAVGGLPSSAPATSCSA